MSFEWFVASRYLRARGRSQFRSLITALAVGGVAVGVGAAIVALGVMNGFTREVRERIVGTNGHLYLLDLEERGFENPDEVRARIEGVDGIVATAPFVLGKVLLTTDTDSEGAILRGMDREAESFVTDIPNRIRPSGASFGPQRGGDGEERAGIVLGADLARKLGAGIGSEVVVTVPSARRQGVPRMRSLVVTGTFESGIFEYDSALAITSIAAAGDALATEGRVTGILARVENMEQAPEVGRRVIDQVTSPPMWANDWIRQNRQLFLWMKLEKVVGYLIFAIILTVAAFLIASTLIMIVLEKTREIGVLLSMGTPPSGILRIFLLEGFAIGGIGTCAGALLGLFGCLALDRYRITLPGDIYFVDTLPVEIWWGDLAVIAGLSLAICVASSIYPAHRASRLAPVEAIRYE
ncbi:MAG: FtsX-like permease family protein [Candidatus Eiseniibacteriota bacterium]